MSSMVGDFVCSSRNLLAQGFRSLPVLLGGSSLIFGMTQANFSFLFFFIGFFILSPTAAFILNGILELLFANVSIFKIKQEFWVVPSGTAEQCALFTTGLSNGPPVPINVVPTFWTTMMSFFFTYLFTNSYYLYTKQEISKASPELVKARKSQTAISMAFLVAVAIVTINLRYATTCETGLGMVIGILLGGSLGYYWYKFMKRCGLGRIDDLYGISNRILPLQSYEEQDPKICVPTNQDS